MKVNANSIRILYRAGKITIDGVKNAVERGWITEVQFKEITGKDYA